MAPACAATLGHRSAHSLVTGPDTLEPFISPLGFTITPALSSQQIKMPSDLRQDLRCRTTTAGITFLRSSGFPFFTVTRTISPMEAAGSLFSLAPNLLTAMMYKIFAPVLSAQFIRAPTGRAKVTRILMPVAPDLPLLLILLPFNRKSKRYGG